MDNRILGYVLLGVSAAFAIMLVIIKKTLKGLIDHLMEQSGGVCIDSAGQCLHEVNNLPITLGFALTAFILAMGIYLVFFTHSERAVVRQLSAMDKKSTDDEKFSMLLRGLDADEQTTLRAIREQDGIQQSTLRLRTSLSKAKLSLVLTNLEKRELISKVPKGKTNQIFLKIRI